jgi:hypothetical protein
MSMPELLKVARLVKPLKQKTELALQDVGHQVVLQVVDDKHHVTSKLPGLGVLDLQPVFFLLCPGIMEQKLSSFYLG